MFGIRISVRLRSGLFFVSYSYFIPYYSYTDGSEILIVDQYGFDHKLVNN